MASRRPAASQRPKSVASYPKKFRETMNKKHGVISMHETIKMCAMERLGFEHLQFLPPIDPPNSPDQVYPYNTTRDKMAAAMAVLLGDPSVKESFISACDYMVKPADLEPGKQQIPDSFFPTERNDDNWETSPINYDTALVLWGSYLSSNKKRERLLQVTFAPLHIFHIDNPLPRPNKYAVVQVAIKRWHGKAVDEGFITREQIEEEDDAITKEDQKYLQELKEKRLQAENCTPHPLEGEGSNIAGPPEPKESSAASAKKKSKLIKALEKQIKEVESMRRIAAPENFKGLHRIQISLCEDAIIPLRDVHLADNPSDPLEAQFLESKHIYFLKITTRTRHILD